MSNSPKLLKDREVQQFIADGYLALQTDVDKQIHENIDRRLRTAAENEPQHGNNVLPRIPELYSVLECPRIHGALISLLGDDYILHPHRAIHRSVPVEEPIAELDIAADGTPMGEGSTAASVWHQDAQSPLARARHHHPRFVIGFYFPHDTPLEMGPTRLQAGSYLWPCPQKLASGVVVPEHIDAGTFMLVHFDMVHAGLSNRSDIDRFMLKFVFSRISNPTQPSWDSSDGHWQTPQYRSAHNLEDAWQHVWHWMRGDSFRPPKKGSLDGLRGVDTESSTNAIYREFNPAALAESLGAKAGLDLHKRRLIAPYKGRQYIRDDVSGYPRRWNERAIVMEPEAYAFAVQGGDAIHYLSELAKLEDPWLDINIAFALGEIGVMNDQVSDILARLLTCEHQQVVRQAIDCVAFIQGDATPFLVHFVRFMTDEHADWQEKEVERGWVAQDQIRLNVMFACICLLSTETDKAQLEEILSLGLSDQGYCAEVAIEGLRRLDTPSSNATALDFAAKRIWDSGLLDRSVAY